MATFIPPSVLGARALFGVAAQASGSKTAAGTGVGFLGPILGSRGISFSLGWIIDEVIEFVLGEGGDQDAADRAAADVKDWASCLADGSLKDFRNKERIEQEPGHGYLIIPGPQETSAMDCGMLVSNYQNTRKAVQRAIQRTLRPAVTVRSTSTRRRR